MLFPVLLGVNVAVMTAIVIFIAVEDAKEQIDREKRQKQADERRELQRPYCSVALSAQPTYQDIAAEIADYSKRSVMFMGPAGVGKSAYINTVQSYMMNRVHVVTAAGKSSSSFTRVDTALHLKHSGREVDWTLIDTPGESFQALVGVFKECGSLCDSVTHGIEARLRQHNVGCMVVVIAANDVLRCVRDQKQAAVDNVLYQLWTVAALHERLSRQGVRMQLLITKCDSVLQPAQDISRLPYNRNMQKIHMLVHKETGLPMNQIFPVVNLTREYHTNENPRLGEQALFAMRFALQVAECTAVQLVEMDDVLTESGSTVLI